ncbi:hypothetical protein [Streptomyces sp. CA-146814]|uniref:hypothetical protein n=1 Tax=Streptomyces sp. CA-146814 TaxID=3240053 RepID=UPI003D8DE9FF
MKSSVPLPTRFRIAFRNFWILASLSAGVAVASDESLLGLMGSYPIEIAIIYTGLLLHPFTPMLHAGAGAPPELGPTAGGWLLKKRARYLAAGVATYVTCAALIGVLGGAVARGREWPAVFASLGDVLTGVETAVLLAALVSGCLLLPGRFFGAPGRHRKADASP